MATKKVGLPAGSPVFRFQRYAPNVKAIAWALTSLLLIAHAEYTVVFFPRTFLAIVVAATRNDAVEESPIPTKKIRSV